MLKGDLSATPLPDVLLALADQSATGCLHIDDEAGDEALVYVKDGRVYSAYVPGRRPQLGARLISSGALAPEALAEALEAQETELQGWRLGELLVHLGYVERPVVEAFVLEQLREAAFDLSRWPSGRYRFRKNEKTRGDVGMDVSVPDLLAEVTRRRTEWEVIAGVVHGAGAVPVLSAGGLASSELTLDQDQWALLCKVDGERTIAQLARDCGFTVFEAGQIVFALVGAGLLDVEETVEEEPEVDADFAPLGAALASALSGGASVAEEEPEADSTLARISGAFDFEWSTEPAEPGSEISRLLAGEPAAEKPVEEPVAEVVAEEPAEPAVEAEPEVVAEVPAEPAVVAEAVEPDETEPAGEPVALQGDLKDELASLTAALADLPSLNLPPSLEPEYPTLPPMPEPAPAEPVAVEPVVEPVEPVAAAAPPVTPTDDPFGDSLARVSEALSALLGDALPTVALPEPPKPQEPSAEELEAARLEAERLERSRAAAAAELAEAHAMAEAARQARLQQQNDVELARIEAERAAAEDAARAEAERVAAEAAQAEAERLAAEQAAAEEAARLEAERAEAERLEAERVEAERVEAERLAAEQAAAEEAARLEAERAEAEQVAAEQEAARLEAERAEAERQEAERLAAEQVAAEEAARREAERAEAERAEAERLEAERAEAERQETERAPEPQVSAFEVASLLRDLNESSIDTVETIEETVPADPEPATAPEPAYASSSRTSLSDTAALLRELTSLGLDDEPSGPSSPPPSAPKPPSAPPKEQPKKRKGLFGRG